ncbi:MAG: NfeD family protein [Clostridia bacterium]|nr:NfeD family protein [Clostridia bacterium]
MEMLDTTLWFLLLIATGIVEAATAGLVCIWFTFGALFALISAALGAGALVQILIFILVSVLSLVFTRPLVKKHVAEKTVSTNSDRIIGTECIVTEDIDNLNNTGAIKANGLIWSAKSSGENIKKGSLVTVLKIEGVHAIVKEKEKEAVQ